MAYCPSGYDLKVIEIGVQVYPIQTDNYIRLISTYTTADLLRPICALRICENNVDKKVEKHV